MNGDPCSLYGSGVYNYFKLMERLLQLFAVLSILASAQMLIYRSFESKRTLSDYMVMAKDITFGNVGFSRTECAKIPIDWLNDDKVKV